MLISWRVVKVAVTVRRQLHSSTFFLRYLHFIFEH